MLYKEYGQTGLSVSQLGFGGMRFEDVEKVDEMAAVMLHAFERGITYFDTAPGYFEGKSEDIFGVAIKEMKKADKPFYISSKTMAATPEDIRRECETSLERMGIDALDFYHVWCLVQPEDLGIRKAQGALDAFRQLKEEGLVKHITVSTHLEREKIEPMLEEGEGIFEGMLLGMNAMNYDLRLEGIQAAASRGMGVVTMNTLGGGLMTNHPEHFEYLMRDTDRSIVDAALRFNLSIPEVTVALVGMRNISDVDEAVDAVEAFDRLSAKDIEVLRIEMAKAAQDFCTQCGYCRDCPAEVPVVRMMDAYNMKLLDGPTAAMNHIKWHWWSPEVDKLLEACTECRACEEACTQHLPILARFEELRKDYEVFRQAQ